MEKLLVLFIHGLGGSKETWGKFEDLLEKDSDLESVIEIRYYEYPTMLTRIPFFRKLKSLTIQELSHSLKTTIDHKYINYTDILLVCHSLGGLVAKHFLSSAFDRATENRVKGIIYFATPHSGAEIASLADVISNKHFHVKQLKKNSEFIDQIGISYYGKGIDSKIDSTYVIAGQDAVVRKSSSGIEHSRNSELIPDKGHLDVVKPNDVDDIAYLILKNTITRLTNDSSRGMDLVRLNKAFDSSDQDAVCNLITSNGRSWIESKVGDDAIEILTKIAAYQTEPNLIFLWSKYLIYIARLFRYRDTSPNLFNEEIIENAKRYNIECLFIAERMEFARKGERREEATVLASRLTKELSEMGSPKSAVEAYSIGTANFLLGNYFRFGGKYDIAQSYIETARNCFTPAILSHLVEIAHCQYSVSICYVMQGVDMPDSLRSSLKIAPELRVFSEALSLLAESHLYWARATVGDAISSANRAADMFESIGYNAYSLRAKSLKGLLECWNLLEHGASHERAVSASQENANILLGALGDANYQDELLRFIGCGRASKVLGILQFAIVFNSAAYEEWEIFSLPEVVSNLGGKLTWSRIEATSLKDAERKLRTEMGIRNDVRVPLFAD